MLLFGKEPFGNVCYRPHKGPVRRKGSLDDAGICLSQELAPKKVIQLGVMNMVAKLGASANCTHLHNPPLREGFQKKSRKETKALPQFQKKSAYSLKKKKISLFLQGFFAGESIDLFVVQSGCEYGLMVN